MQRHSVAGVDYVDVIYTIMLAWNGSISLLPGQGEHPNDVETTIVRFNAADLDHPVRYMFQQHGGFSWGAKGHTPASTETAPNPRRPNPQGNADAAIPADPTSSGEPKHHPDGALVSVPHS
ncbi:hypothetical protein [Sorangium sp. So ce131]|uniref:hypothetical protein n=1 Tax=Sorangium sp. So ce131 TaxID=3133282 RepID=UPI003F630167